MAYTKTTWNTGDVITAEKLNHMEDGITSAQAYTVSEDVRFSGSVTTVDDDGEYYADIDCDLSDAPEQIKVVFDGTEYTCEKLAIDGPVAYGGFNDGPDFSEYPFCVIYVTAASLLTETASTHQVEITAVARSINQDLGNLFPLIIKNTITKREEIENAFARNRLVYFVQANKYYFITAINPISFIPENSTIGISFDPDGTIVIGGG